MKKKGCITIIIVVILAMLCLAILAAVGIYYYLNTQSNQNGPIAQGFPTAEVLLPADPNVIPSAGPTPSEEIVDINSVVEAAIKNENYESLLPYLANEVFVRLEASGCCGPLSPAEVVIQLSYLEPADTWDFGESDTKTNLAQASEFYSVPYDAAIANNKMIFSYKVNQNGKIDAINLGATYELLIP